jgi:putative ABC transport system ATP-binding protein
VPELNAAENVALPLLLDGTKRTAALTDAVARMSALGVAHLADRQPTAMSGGEAQRVALARALVARPRVLFADEPTGALDSESSEVVLRLVREAAAQLGTSVLLVTHDRDVASIADRVVTMRDGRITAGANT